MHIIFALETSTFSLFPMLLGSYHVWIPLCGFMSLFAVLLYGEASHWRVLTIERIDPTIENNARSRLNAVILMMEVDCPESGDEFTIHVLIVEHLTLLVTESAVSQPKWRSAKVINFATTEMTITALPDICIQ